MLVKSGRAYQLSHMQIALATLCLCVRACVVGFDIHVLHFIHTFLPVHQPLLAAVVNNILKTKEYLTVPVTTAEFAVMRTACSVCSYHFYQISFKHASHLIAVASFMLFCHHVH